MFVPTINPACESAKISETIKSKEENLQEWQTKALYGRHPQERSQPHFDIHRWLKRGNCS